MSNPSLLQSNAFRATAQTARRNSKGKGIFICGYYGHHNLGDEAMLAGMVSLFKNAVPDASISVMSDDPKYTASLHPVHPIQHTRRFTRRIDSTLNILKHQYFILGGGDLLRDAVDQYVSQIWLSRLQKAIALRRHTMVLGINVGEIWRPETKEIIAQVLNKVDLIAVRDNQSKLKLESFGVSKKIYVTSDLALHALPDPSSLPREDKDKLRVGISVRPLKGRGRSVNLDIYPQLQKQMAAITDFLIEQYDAEVHFLPFQTLQEKYHPSDDYVSTLECLRYSRFSEKVILHRHFDSLKDLYQLISQLDLVVGTRLHSLILAAGLGIPIIAAEYDPKVAGFMHEINQGDLSIPLEDFKLNSVSAKISRIIEKPVAAQTALLNGVSQYRLKSNELIQKLHEIMK